MAKAAFELDDIGIRTTDASRDESRGDGDRRLRAKSKQSQESDMLFFDEVESDQSEEDVVTQAEKDELMLRAYTGEFDAHHQTPKKSLSTPSVARPELLKSPKIKTPDLPTSS